MYSYSLTQQQPTNDDSEGGRRALDGLGEADRDVVEGEEAEEDGAEPQAAHDGHVLDKALLLDPAHLAALPPDAEVAAHQRGEHLHLHSPQDGRVSVYM